MHCIAGMKLAIIFEKIVPKVRLTKHLTHALTAKTNSDCLTATREVLCTEMLRYVQSLNNVDIIFKDNKLPSVEQYWERREATAAALCVVATIPYVGGSPLVYQTIELRP